MKKNIFFLSVVFLILCGVVYSYYNSIVHKQDNSADKKTKISILVITYNQEKYVEDCIKSIINQDIEKEIIITDDHSDDSTWEKLQNLKKEYPEIMVYQNEHNLGTVLNRYEGMKRASGEYILFVDGDDILMPGALPKLYKEASDNKADILEFSFLTDGNDSFTNIMLRSKETIDGDLLSAYKNKKITNMLVNKLISRDVYMRVLPKINTDVKQSNFSDVVYFLYHFLMNANKLVKTNIIGYYYFRYRGTTYNSSYIARLKNYCDFIATKQELNRVYGHIDALERTFEIVKSQALEIFSELSEEDKRIYKSELLKLMSEEEIKEKIGF